MVTFYNGEKAEYDVILLCTGYNIAIPYLDKSIRRKIFSDESETILKVLKIIFNSYVSFKQLIFC